MSKIKEWIKEHKKELIISSVSVAVGAVGGVALYKYSRKALEASHEASQYICNTIFPAMKGAKGVTFTNFKRDGKTNVTVKDCQELIKGLAEEDWCDPDRGVAGIAVFLKEETK